MVRVLIVDDDEDVVKIFEKILNSRGYDIIGKAFDGNQAIELYKGSQNLPDLVLMDHRMPNKDGLSATKEILEINSECKIIFVSADASIKSKALETGAISFIEKPVNMSRLLKIIEKVLT